MRSWLLRKKPPVPLDTPEQQLWWAVIRQAAYDLRFSYRANSIDALEFLVSSGLWLATEILTIEARTYQEEVVRLLHTRNRLRRPLPGTTV